MKIATSIAFAVVTPLCRAFTTHSSTTFVSKAGYRIANSVQTSGCTCACAACTGNRAGYCCAGCTTHRSGCGCGTCKGSPASCFLGCNCAACSSTLLFMSDADVEEAVTVDDEVPAEVAALDGIESKEEAHNTERPSRGSGIQKHKKTEPKGTPLSELEIGSSVEGTIKTITSYGAFVDIGAETDGLLHVSRLSVDFVSNVEDHVKTGDTVTVRIVNVDKDKKQIGISMLTEDEENKANEAKASSGGKRKSRPQRSGGDRQSQIAVLQALSDAGFDSDTFIEGEVVSTLDFGAFVRFAASQLAESVEGELDGLVHISSLCAGRADSVESIVSVGDKVQVRLKSIDVEGNKSSLSMITAEEEKANRPNRNSEGGGGKPRRGRQLFSENEMGAKNWKESLDKFQTSQPTFTNEPVVRK